jgi:uncharacterized protein YfaS (alpha-2-macroglobulin family)
MNQPSKPSLYSRFTMLLASIVGQVQWTSPTWLSFLRRQAKTRPFGFWSEVLAFLLILTSMGYGYSWYKNRPIPPTITANITAPKITPITDETPVPDVLTVDFGFSDKANPNNPITPQSVAPLSLIGQPVEKGITLTPSIKGQWFWQSDNKLVFTPETDWPAGQTYTLHFSKDNFSKTTTLGEYRYTFSTQPFEAKITTLSFYQDPVHAANRQAVATIEFNFPVDPKSLEQHTSLMLQAMRAGQLDLHAQNYPVTMTFDKQKRTAYLHSDNINLPEVSRYLRLSLDKGIQSATGSDATHATVSQNLLIPDVSNYFKVLNATGAIVRNAQDRPEQVVVLESSIGITEQALRSSLHLYLLPENYPASATEEEKKHYEWQNPGEVTPTILKLASKIKLHAIPTEENYARLHSYQVHLPANRYLYLQLDKGTRGFGNIALSRDVAFVIKVPELPKEISFLHKGALLALSGEKKLSVLVRGIKAVQFNFARILPDNINQLVTQTQGDFNNPSFINKSFNQQNISQISTDIQSFDSNALNQQQYTALDFGKYLSAATNTAGPNGLFILEAREWDSDNNVALDTKASRLILITDLGLIVKDNQDGTHDVLVQSITDGTPKANVAVSVLGKNGLPLLTHTTNEQGRVTFPTLTTYLDDREPVVYLAKLEQDVSFIPYRNANRELNFSRFDIGGNYTNTQDPHHLSAYIFSDRGIYRPGDTAHIGVIVKQAYVMPQPSGLPLQATVIDSRGTTIQDQTLTLDALGYLTLNVPTQATSPTGHYQVNVYTIKDKHPESLIGSATLRVEEFQPDRMRIQSTFSPKPALGFVSPRGLTAQVDLWNLYGAPAANREIHGRILLQPKAIEFKAYPDYQFADPLLDPKKPAKVLTEDLASTKTDDKGQASFALHLDRFEKASYQLTFFAEGFEADGGRSVATQSSVLVSPLPYFVGYKADSDFKFIQHKSQHEVQLIAINPELKSIALTDLTLQLQALTPVSTLVKKPNGTYQYESIIQTNIIHTEPLHIDANGAHLPIATDKIGNFALCILDKDNNELSRIPYTIVGTSQRTLDKNAELDVKIDRETYEAGDDIALQITAPYTGAGLITIERDKVYATQWFKTDTTSSVQHIHIPKDFQGNGYVNVTFVRDWNSPDIFISPLSYSVTPFAVDDAAHAIQIDLNVPKTARPGEPFSIQYHSDKPGKMIVFAVDEGILQVANYQTPDPLAFFFQKQALEVLTQQTVDQILPKYIQDRELSSVGGDGGEALLAAHLNPFKRKTDLPVAFWSGMVDTDTTTRELTYDVPNYFNGSLRVMAVAVAMDAVGAAEQSSEIRGDFIINPNTPSFVAPLDEFEVTASIANQLKQSGENANVKVTLQTSSALELIGSNTQTLAIAEGKEKVAHFKLRAKSELGSTQLTFTAAINDTSSTMDATLSVRPAQPFFTAVESGQRETSKQVLPLIRNLYPEYREVDIAMSNSPLILAAGLQRYLDNYPYGCTEQLTSKVFPLLAIANQPWLSMDMRQITDKITESMRMLSQRQMSNGGFSYWPGLGDNQGNPLTSTYATHFLTDAKAQGFFAPTELFNNAIHYLKDLATQNPTSLEMARTQAYAIYVLTRNEIVTTNELTNLQLYLDAEHAKVWQSDLTGAYMAATYQLLKNQNEANRLIAAFKPQATSTPTSDFYDQNIANAQYLYLIAHHFPERLSGLGDTLVLQLVSAMNQGEMNTLLSSYTSMALAAYAQSTPDAGNTDFSIVERLLNGQDKSLATILHGYGTASVDKDAKQLQLLNPKQRRYFYQLVEAGFDKSLPTQEIAEGLEIHREYRDKTGHVIDSTSLGDEIEVHIQVKALKQPYVNHVAIVDLLPGGFEVVRDSVKTDQLEYADIREDRVVFFGFIDATAKEIVYRIKSTNIGKYTVPPIVAEAMYDPGVKARGMMATMTVLPGDVGK